VVPLLLAHGIGRVGCFLAGCCYGCLVPGTALRHPVQLYESIFLLVMALLICRLERRHLTASLGAYLVAYSGFRFFIEFLRADVRGGTYGLTTSQWVSMPLFAVGMVMLVRHFLQAERKQSTSALDPIVVQLM